MLYLVTNQQRLFDNDIHCISINDSLDLLNSVTQLQFDTETTGKNPHLNKILCIQFGSKDKFQIVVDTTTIDIHRYKLVIENKNIIGHNLKFDLQFLYNHGIIPRKVYDTMIVEQLLYLGYPSKGNIGGIGYSLADVAQRRLGIYLDKSVRGEIIWRGLDDRVIRYAANDVVVLEDILESQWKDCIDRQCTIGAQLENKVVPAMAYLEWCGIKLDEDKWKEKMLHDKKRLEEALDNLNNYCLNHPKLQKFKKINNQLDLFSDITNIKPYFAIDWQKNEAKQVFKLLGFNINTVSKTTGKEAESLLEKNLASQKGIDDELLKLYFNYQEAYKVTTSFGQGFINAINPITGRLHTQFKQLGAASGRMSCGGSKDEELARLKHINPKDCPMPNIQQLPANEETREAFVSEEGNLFVSCDYSALESRLGADIYQEPAMLEEFLHGSGDMHSLCAKMVFHEELKDVAVKDIKKVRPDLRKLVKSVEFAKQFGGSEHAIAGTLGCSIEEASKFSQAYDTGFKGVTKFKQFGAKEVKEKGYVLICKYTGHKMYWWDWKEWKDFQDKTKADGYWDEYRRIKNYNPEDSRVIDVKRKFKASSKWERMALNGPTQGTGVIILKDSMIALFNWIVDNNYFNKIKLCAAVHDELCIEFPEELTTFPKFLENLMQQSAARYCKSLPIPAEASVGKFWIH